MLNMCPFQYPVRSALDTQAHRQSPGKDPVPIKRQLRRYPHHLTLDINFEDVFL